MNAGKTDIAVGTKVRVTHIANIEDEQDKKLVGIVGEITHPFPGLMIGSEKQYVAGLFVEAEEAKKHGLGLSPLGDGQMNLVRGDRFDVVA